MVTISSPEPTTKHRIPVMTGESVVMSQTAIQYLCERMMRIGRIQGVRETCELMDELLFDDVGDALATIAPALPGMGISEAEVAR